MRGIVYDQEELIIKAIERGLITKGIKNLLDFWPVSIRLNFMKFEIYPKILSVIEEIDKKIEIFEEKMEKSRNLPKSPNKNEMGDLPPDYKPIIKKDEENKNIRSPYKYSKNYKYKYNNIGGGEKDKNVNAPSGRTTGKNRPGNYNINIKKEKEEKNNNEILKPINNLESMEFRHQEEKLGQNIIEILKKDQNIISYIDIDLFLQRLAQGKKIYDDMNEDDILLNGFCIQHTIFIPTKNIISKIISCFHYYYKIYLNKHKKRASAQYRVKINLEEKKNFFARDQKKIPYHLIDLLILFIDLHDKYSKEALEEETINEISSFFDFIMGITDIQQKYKNDIEYTKKVLNSIKIGSILKRQKTQKVKIDYEKIVRATGLLGNIIRDPEKPLSFFNILNYNSVDVAKELTRISYKLFSKIKPKEFFKGVFTKKNKEITSPNITATSDRFNQVSFWVIEEILAYDYSSDRARVIEKLIDITKELINLNNYYDSVSMMSGLGQIIIKNLIKTWKHVSKESSHTFEKIKNILNFQDNYKNIRDRIEDCLLNNRPYIPFLGPYNKRICFLEEYGPYVKDVSLINVDKIVLVQNILDQLYKFKKKQYEIISSEKKEFIIFQCLDPLPEDELDKLASSLEPNFSLNDKKNREKRTTNTEKNFRENYDKLEYII